MFMVNVFENYDFNTIFYVIVGAYHVINAVLMRNWDKGKKIKMLLFTCVH